MQSILRLVLLVAIAPIIFLQGCDSTSNESLPNSGVSLCINLYEMCVEPILHNPTATGASCSQAGCHNPPVGQDGFFLYNPPTPAELMANNFPQVEARTLNNDLLLSKATGGAGHGGGKQFNVGDLCYNTIAEWRAIAAPTDGSACTATIPNCPLAPALIATCGL